MKNEVGGKIITTFIAIRPKGNSCLTDDDKNVKKLKEKNCVMKRTLKFNDYKNFLFKNEIKLK